MRFCGNFILSCDVAVFKTKGFAVFRNFWVILMQLAVLLCYSLWFCGIRTPPPPQPLRALIKCQRVTWRWVETTTKKDNPKYNSEIPTELHGLDLLNMHAKWLLLKFRQGTIPPPPTLRGLGSSPQAGRGDPGIFQIGGRMRGLKTSKYCNYFKPLFSPFWTCCYIFLFCVAKFITDEMQIKLQTIRSFAVSHLFLLCSF